MGRRRTGRSLGQSVQQKHAAMKDVPMEPSKEEFAIDMEQSALLRRNAAMKDVPMEPSKEEFVGGMEQR